MPRCQELHTFRGLGWGRGDRTGDRAGAALQVLMSSFIRLHVPQSIIQIVNVLNSNSLVDFFSVCKRQIRIRRRKSSNRKDIFTSRGEKKPYMLSADIFITPTQSACCFPSAIIACIHLLKTNLWVSDLKCGRNLFL